MPAKRTHPAPRDGHCPMCGRRLLYGECLHDGYHADPARCLSCRNRFHLAPVPANTNGHISR
jgi:hypothetical protein